MKWVGAHVSAAGGVHLAPLNAAAIGAKAFGVFTKNQRRWSAKPLQDDVIAAFQANCARLGFSSRHILAHDSYLINLGHPNNRLLDKSRAAFIEEMSRCDLLGIGYLNFHPGRHLGQIPVVDCLTRIAESINLALSKTHFVTAVLEITAGQGSDVGRSFEELAQIIELVADKARIGVCLDTCHLFAAGYDIRDKVSYKNSMNQFAQIIGFAFLKGLHLNDSKKGLASHVDRHAELGKGQLGWQSFRQIMNDHRLENIPLILETPNTAQWSEEIAQLYSLIDR